MALANLLPDENPFDGRVQFAMVVRVHRYHSALQLFRHFVRDVRSATANPDDQGFGHSHVPFAFSDIPCDSDN